MVGQEQEGLCSISALYRPDDSGSSGSICMVVCYLEPDGLGETRHAGSEYIGGGGWWCDLEVRGSGGGVAWGIEAYR